MIEPLLFWEIVSYTLIIAASAFFFGHIWSLRIAYIQLGEIVDIDSQIKIWRKNISRTRQPAYATTLAFVTLNHTLDFSNRYAALTLFFAIVTGICSFLAWKQEWNRPVLEDRAPTTDVDEPLMRRWIHFLYLSQIAAGVTFLSILVGIYFRIPEEVKNMRLSYH